MATPLHLAARAVVNAEDPIGLLAIDAPEDEYDPEVRDLLKRRTALKADDVIDVFVRWFGADYRLPEDMAHRIANGINDAIQLEPDGRVGALPPQSRRMWRRLVVSQAPAGDLEALSTAPAAVREFNLLTGDTVHDLRGLRHLPDSLEELSLAAVWKGRPSLTPLARFQALRRLALDARSGPLRDVDVLGRFPDLRVLWLAGFKGLDLTPLLRLPALQALEVSFGSRTSDLSGLAEIPTLSFLDINWSRRPDALDGLGAVRSLEYLSVSACSQVTAVPDLSRLERLRFVIIESQKRLTDISGLALAPNLEQVLLVNMPQATPRWLAPVVGHPTLQRLSVGTGSYRGNALAQAAHGLPEVDLPRHPMQPPRRGANRESFCW